MTALMNAAAYDTSGRALEFLLENGADPRLLSDTRASALSYAITEGNVTAVRLLVEFDPGIAEIGDDPCTRIEISRVSTDSEKRELREVLC